ncbi:MAG TPA: RNA polymerase sigma factor [Kofleriaceae bacterium]
MSNAHGAYLHALARKLCRSQFDPEDLVQDVFEKTLRSPIPDGANARAWLTRVLHNVFVDKLRRRAARHEDLVERLPEAPPREGEKAWWEALTEEHIRAELQTVPEELRKTFELFAFEDRTYDEIAAALGIAKATVGTRILRVRQRLRERFEERRDG